MIPNLGFIVFGNHLWFLRTTRLECQDRGPRHRARRGSLIPHKRPLSRGGGPKGRRGGALPPLQGEVVRVSEPEGLFLRLNTPQPPLQGGLSFPLDANWYDCLVEALAGNVRQACLMKNTPAPTSSSIQLIQLWPHHNKTRIAPYGYDPHSPSIMEPANRLELLTCALRVRCSTN